MQRRFGNAVTSRSRENHINQTLRLGGESGIRTRGGLLVRPLFEAGPCSNGPSLPHPTCVFDRLSTSGSHSMRERFQRTGLSLSPDL